MGSCKICSLAILCILGIVVDAASGDVSFDDNYEVIWGSGHIIFLNNRRDVQLWMDESSGAGFGSKLNYGSGFFHMRIKLPNKDSKGVITTFYLTSNSSNHDELDFEFLGNVEGKPISLQTNVYANGIGNREQKIFLWFDPSADYHTYQILWNPNQIVFYVDEIPIRVYKNKVNPEVKYPSQPMRIEASLWHGDWAGQTNWTHAPFTAQYQGFDFGGCPSPQNGVDCSDPKYWWNGSKYWKLNEKEQKELEQVRLKYMNYDYCADRNRFPTPPPECAFNK